MVILRKKLILSIAATIMLELIMSAALTTSTYALSRACKNSAACMEAVAKEKEASANAAQASQTASAYQSKVNDLNYEIAVKELQIAETTAQIDDLKEQIAAVEKKLGEEQAALAELLVNIHFGGDAEPITILAGSSSLSDLAEKSARTEVVKQQISLTARKIKDDKEQLEADKAEVENLLAEQEEAKATLVKTRREQQELVAKYQSDAAAYDEAAKAAKEAQRAAEKAEQEAHPELYRGSFYTGVNTYPWQADCPARQDAYITYWEDAFGYYKIGGYVCECVSYAGWKAYEAFGVPAAWGNAYSWDDAARALGYTVNNIPAPDTIGQTNSGIYGHVFWVEEVNSDGSISVTEYNNYYATYLYSGSSHSGDFGSRTIPASEVWRYNYIHFE